MNQRIAKCILGIEEPNEIEQPLIDLLKQHLALDNNKLREDYVCSLLGYTPTFGGGGFPDGHTPDNTCVDNKSGPEIVFPDGKDTIEDKLDWECLVQKFDDDGRLVYIAEVKVSEIIDELRESRDQLISKNARVSPMVGSAVWLYKPSTKVLYKNPNLFERTKSGRLRKFYKILNELPMADNSLPVPEEEVAQALLSNLLNSAILKA